jgi:hypothetical protein
MIVRAALLPFLLLLLAAPVLAQPPRSQNPGFLTAGSLTVMSRPGGAAVRITGDQSVVGRTPFTLDRGLVGRYVITGSEIGYERWRRTISLDGVSADTIWMTLSQKNPAMAGLRSIILPGWGQFYDDNPGRGTIFLGAAILAGAGYAFAEIRMNDREDDLAAATTPEEVEHATERLDDARDLRKYVLIGGGVVWGLSVIDAIASVPRPVGPVLLGARIAPSLRLTGRDGVGVTIARLGF